MTWADQKLDTMPAGVPLRFLGVDNGGRPVLGRSQYLSVIDYGVVGNGVVNDSAAMQAAIQYAVSQGIREVVIPGGYTYSVTNVRFRSNIRYIIEENAVILADPSSVLGGATINTNDEHDIVIEGGIFDGNYDVVPGDPTNGNTLLRCSTCQNITVRGSLFRDNKYLAIQASQSSQLRFLENAMDNTDCGIITMQACEEVWATGNSITGGTSDGIAIWASSTSAVSKGIHVIGNTVYDKTGGFGVIMRRVEGGEVIGNSIRNVIIGIAGAGAAETVPSTGLNIVGNNVSGATSTYGIGGHNIDDSTIVGNTISDCENHGIYMARCNRNIVTGNTIRDINGAATDSAGISLNDASNFNIIAANAVFDTRTPIENYAGIAVTGSFENTIQNNTIPNAMATYPNLLLPSAQSNYVEDNRGVVTDQGVNNIILRNRSGSSNTTVTSPTISLRDSPGDIFTITATSAQTISTINNGFAGRKITLLFTRTDTIVDDAGNILLDGGTLTSTVNGTLTLMYSGTKWYEISRRLNNI